MIRPYRLQDVLSVRRLKRRGVWLNLFYWLVQGQNPVLTGLIAPVPWHGAGLASFVWRQNRSATGFVQMLKRPNRPEADLLFITPDLGQQADAEMIQLKLLTYCIRNAGQHGIRRLYASLPRDSAQIDEMAGLGFAVYSNEDIYRLKRPPADASPANGRIRTQNDKDAWWLRRLYSLYTPAPVQQAEGMADRDSSPTALPVPWWELSQQRSYVLVEKGDVLGGIQIVSGRRGHWLFLYGDPADSQCSKALIRQGLHVLAGNRWPVYCAARDYQGGRQAVLEDSGFELYTSRSRLVKHTTIKIKAAEMAPAPSLVAERST